MVTKKTIKVPIYDYKVVIVVADAWEEAHELYPSIGGGREELVYLKVQTILL